MLENVGIKVPTPFSRSPPVISKRVGKEAFSKRTYFFLNHTKKIRNIA